MKKIKAVEAAVKSDEAKRFKVFRQAEGLSQQEMADVLGVKQPTIQRYESGVLYIPDRITKKMHHRLNMSYEWYFEGKGARKNPTTSKKSDLLTDVKQLSTELSLVKSELASIKKTLHKVYNDFYATKHDVGVSDDPQLEASSEK